MVTKKELEKIIDAPFSFEIKGFTSSFRGVYLLKDNDNVVYVGQTTMGLKRMLGHFEDKVFDTIVVKEIPEGINLLIIEAEYIMKYLPKYNRKIEGYISFGIARKILKGIDHSLTLFDVRRVVKELNINVYKYRGYKFLYPSDFELIKNELIK